MVLVKQCSRLLVCRLALERRSWALAVRRSWALVVRRSWALGEYHSWELVERCSVVLVVCKSLTVVFFAHRLLRFLKCHHLTHLPLLGGTCNTV